MALGLSGRARQLTLAFASASWVIAAVIGPAYAAWVTHLLSWRWAMLLYLPLLVVARFVIAFSLKIENEKKDVPISYEAVALIIVGVTCTVAPVTGVAKAVLLLVGVALLARVIALLMPAGTFAGRTPRRAALAGMFLLTGSYFAANELISLTAHDVYHATADSLGYILTGGGLAWAAVGVLCGMKPAHGLFAYRLRSTIGVTLLIASALTMSVLAFNEWPLPSPTLWFVAVWTTAGVGMGLTYLDTLNVFFEEPDVADGISIEEMASASVIVESLASTMFVPLTASIVAVAFAGGHLTSTTPYGVSWLIVLILAVAALCYLRNVRPSSRT